MAEKIAEEQIPVDQIYKISDQSSWALDFYNQKPVQITSAELIKNKKGIWVYADDKELKVLKDDNAKFWWLIRHCRANVLSVNLLNSLSIGASPARLSLIMVQNSPAWLF